MNNYGEDQAYSNDILYPISAAYEHGLVAFGSSSIIIIIEAISLICEGNSDIRFDAVDRVAEIIVKD